jgi:tRNA pseudouridine38-40 synthase
MGSQRQPGERTVEGEVIRCLRKVGAIESLEEARFRVASRTDRGVSALWNVVSFDTNFREDRLLRALNGVSEGVAFMASAKVDHGFNPRMAAGRWYRYLAPADDVALEEFRECARLFVGTHDFRRFCKPEGRNTIKEVRSIEVLAIGEMIVIDLRAREFLRNMVRRMVAAMLSVGKAEAALDEVLSALAGKESSFGLAPAEGLTLMQIDHGLEWNSAGPQLAPLWREKRTASMQALMFQEMVLDALGGNG